MAILKMQSDGASSRSDRTSIIPLVIDAKDYWSSAPDRHHTLPSGVTFQGADQQVCQKVLQSSENAARNWSQSSPSLRRRHLMQLSQV